MENWLISMLNDICGGDLMNAIFETLSIDFFTGDYRDASTQALYIYTWAIKPVALMILYVYFMISVVDKLSSENFTWEQFWRGLAMLLACKYLIENFWGVTKNLYYIGHAIAASIQGVTGYFGDTSSGVAEAKALLASFKTGLGIDKWPAFLSDLVMMIYLLIPWLISWVMRLCVSIICYTRVLEMFIRMAFMPFALADLYQTGLQGSGWRQIKGFFALCLQGAIILAIGVIFSSLVSGIIANDQNLFTFLGKYLAFFAATIMLMFKSLSLSKEIVGAA